MGVFASFDLFLFFLFWEIELIPMFLLIGIWGGARREYAAWKFLLYTLIGSVLHPGGIFLIYFADRRASRRPSSIFAADGADRSPARFRSLAATVSLPAGALHPADRRASP